MDIENLDKVDNVNQTLWRFKDQELIAEPAKQYQYSNNSYQLVDAIIESVRKTSFQNQLKEMCLKLGMKSTLRKYPKSYISLHQDTINQKITQQID